MCSVFVCFFYGWVLVFFVGVLLFFCGVTKKKQNDNGRTKIKTNEGNKHRKKERQWGVGAGVFCWCCVIFRCGVTKKKIYVHTRRNKKENERNKHRKKETQTVGCRCGKKRGCG